MMNTENLAPALIIGDRKSGKTSKLIEIANDFYEKHSKGWCLFFSTDPTIFEVFEKQEVSAGFYWFYNTLQSPRVSFYNPKGASNVAKTGLSDITGLCNAIARLRNELDKHIELGTKNEYPTLLLVDDLLELGNMSTQWVRNYFQESFNWIAANGQQHNIYIAAATRSSTCLEPKICLDESFHVIDRLIH